MFFSKSSCCTSSSFSCGICKSYRKRWKWTQIKMSYSKNRLQLLKIYTFNFWAGFLSHDAHHQVKWPSECTNQPQRVTHLSTKCSLCSYKPAHQSWNMFVFLLHSAWRPDQLFTELNMTVFFNNFQIDKMKKCEDRAKPPIYPFSEAYLSCQRTRGEVQPGPTITHSHSHP